MVKMEERNQTVEIDIIKELYEKPRRLILIILILGAFLLVLGFFIIVISYAVEFIDAGIDFEVAFILGWFLFGIGLFMCIKITIMKIPKPHIVSYYLDKFFEVNEKPEKSIRFYSFALSRLIGSLLLLIMGFVDLFILTGGLSHHSAPFGQAIVLGGPSYFYTVGLFPSLFGIGLLLYVMISSFRGVFSNSKNNLYFHEFRPTSPWTTKILKKDIEALRYQNNNLGPKLIWVVLLMPFIVLSFIEGFYLINMYAIPRLETPIQGILLIFSAIMECFALFFLVLTPQHYFEIATKDDLYEMWFEPEKSKIRLKEIDPITEEISEVFECSMKKEEISEFMKSNQISTTHRSYTNLILGFFFIATSIVMWNFFILFGTLYWWFAIIFGSILVIRAISQDFSDVNGDLIEYNDSDKILKFQRKFRYKFFKIRTYKPTELKLAKQFRKLDFFDVAAIPGLLFFISLQITQSWALATSTVLILDSVISTIFMVVVCFLIFIYLCVPLDQVKFKTSAINYYIPVTLKSREKFNFKVVLSKPLKKTFLLRLLFIVIMVVATIIGTSIYLASSFV
ncbi:hypothetical protein ES706_05121 [subsurface metagenome]